MGCHRRGFVLLVISDLHLEEHRALPDPLLDRFFDMIESVCKRAALRDVPDVTFVLLGDILGCLKNTRWLGEVRPWHKTIEGILVGLKDPLDDHREGVVHRELG